MYCYALQLDMRVATYSRVSTSHHEQKPEVQVLELRRYCAARGWLIVHELVDHGYSGSTDSRPSLKVLMSLVRSRQIDAVVVVKLDRLFRSLKHLVLTLEELQGLGITFVATKDNVDYSTPTGRLFVQILGSLAEFEKALFRERTIMGLEHARASGKRLGRPRKRDDQAILRLRKEGLSYSAIQLKLGISRGAIYRATRAVSKSPLQVEPETLVIPRVDRG